MMMPLTSYIKTYLQLLSDRFRQLSSKTLGKKLKVGKKNPVQLIFCCSASVHDPRSLFRNLVGCVGPEDGSWTRVRPLLEQRPRRCGVCPRLCLVTLGQTSWPRAPVDIKCLNELELRTSSTARRYSGSPEHHYNPVYHVHKPLKPGVHFYFC